MFSGSARILNGDVRPWIAGKLLQGKAVMRYCIFTSAVLLLPAFITSRQGLACSQVLRLTPCFQDGNFFQENDKKRGGCEL